MFRLMFSDCLEPLNAQLQGEDIQLNSFSTDTRTLNPGDIYIALRGDNFDGHDYISQAEEAGAAGFVVSRSIETSKPYLQVADTLLALQEISKIWAQGHQVPTIAITGSNGKTTTKELVAAILRQLGPVLATEGNLNNEIGVPLTLLKLRQEHQYAVIEMGASAVGEIKVLSRLASPDVAVVTNTEAAHLEGFGSLLDIAHAKGEIYSGVSNDGWAVLYADDDRADILEAAASNCNIRTFGKNEDADVHAGNSKESFRVEGVGDAYDISFSLLGDHNRLNALAAIAAVQCLDAQADTIQAGLASVKPVARRLEQKPGAAGSTLIDDSYNANPASARAGIDVLASFSGKRMLILGDMLELGDEAVQQHKGVGLYAKRKEIDTVWTVGELAQHASNAAGGRHFSSQEDLLENLLPELDKDTTLLLKGSRGARMDRLVDALLANEPPVLNTRVTNIVPEVVI